MMKTLKYCVALCLSALAVQASEDPHAGRPHEHFCPLTHEVMRDPVVALDGYSYERSAILAYFRRATGAGPILSPQTRVPLDAQTLIPNVPLKAMISEWRRGGDLEPSPLDHLDATQIADLMEREFAAHQSLLHASRGRHIVAFLGNTGAGKSTLVNLLAGKQLENRYNQNYVLEFPDDPTAMAIGTGADSQTLYTKFVEVEDLLFFDLPGFNDTEGSVRNLVNAAFMRHILMEAASVRAVFVMGQDEFTARRGQSAKELFGAMGRLVVAGSEEADLVKNAVFVLTKSTCYDLERTVDFLLERTTTATRPHLQTQLQAWNSAGRLNHMYHPMALPEDVTLDDTRAHILATIRSARPVRVLGMNVSVLYPLEMRGALVGMFGTVIERQFERSLTGPLSEPLETLSAYDTRRSFYAADSYWHTFGEQVCAQTPSVALLKGFCIDPYNEALRTFQGVGEARRQAHIRWLEDQRAERVTRLEKEAETKAQTSLRAFGRTVSAHYADPKEQDVVQRHFASYVDMLVARLEMQERLEAQERELATLRPLTGRLDVLERELAALRPAPAGAGSGGASGSASGMVVPRPIPDIARGHEELYHKFMRGKLVYKPNADGSGMVEVPISSLANPLEGTFDLPAFGHTGRYISIHTGYKKGKIAANSSKLEIWACPKFLGAKAPQFAGIMSQWESPVAYFWTWGGQSVAADNFDYLLKTEFCMNNELNCYEKWNNSSCSRDSNMLRSLRRNRPPGEITITYTPFQFFVFKF